MRNALIWIALCAIVIVPIALAAGSPLLAWRDPIYILAGFAGIVGMTLLLVQPLLIAGALPGVHGRRLHRVVGIGLVVAVVVHVAGLWVTSPPDVIDVLLFASPTPFGVWGALSMWAVFGAALVAILRRRLRPRLWRLLHIGLAVVIVGGTIAHAILIEGTMEIASKIALSGIIILINISVLSKALRRVV